jgi:uncharacterized phage protein (TIGR02220 family)
MPARGVYRGVSSVLFDDPDYQRLPTPARCLLVTLRLCRDAGPAAIFEYSADKLMRQTGLSRKRLEASFHILETEHWIEREPPIIWIRNGLRYDPVFRPSNPYHQSAILSSLQILPRWDIVARFCRYYDLPVPPGVPLRVATSQGLGIRDKGLITTMFESAKIAADSNVASLREPTNPEPAHPEHAQPADPLTASRREQARAILAFLNQQAGRTFRDSQTNLALIEARLRSGMTPANLRGIIARKTRAWRADPKMAPYLRPATLFNATKAEQYLGERDPES